MNASVIIFYIILCTLFWEPVYWLLPRRRYFVRLSFLLFSLIGIAGLFFWMQVEFIAAVQIIVYVGGIVVLIIFSIFLTQQSGDEMPRPVKNRDPIFSPGCYFADLHLPII